jgi:ATP-dependent Clp protease protease subunit
VAALLYLDSQDSDTQINLYINSEGGNIRSVFMIYDVMTLIKSPIQTICLGAATGAPALLLAAGAPGFRSATKSSFLCVSQLQADSAMYVDMTDAKIAFSQLKRDNKKYIETLAKLTGKKVVQVTKDSERKLFLNPGQAKRYGLIDHVLEWTR